MENSQPVTESISLFSAKDLFFLPIDQKNRWYKSNSKVHLRPQNYPLIKDCSKEINPDCKLKVIKHFLGSAHAHVSLSNLDLAQCHKSPI